MDGREDGWMGKLAVLFVGAVVPGLLAPLLSSLLWVGWLLFVLVYWCCQRPQCGPRGGVSGLSGALDMDHPSVSAHPSHPGGHIVDVYGDGVGVKGGAGSQRSRGRVTQCYTGHAGRVVAVAGLCLVLASVGSPHLHNDLSVLSPPLPPPS